MAALDRPTLDELRRGEIAAAVRDGRITPREAQVSLGASEAGSRPDSRRADAAQAVEARK